MLKIGLIGCGGMGLTHASAYKILSDTVRVVAVADVVKEKAEEAAKLVSAEKIYSSGEELLANEKLDFVDICLPTYMHTSHAVMAMEKGMNVFLEKPVCMNEEEAQLLLETQKKTGAIVQIGLCLRFNDAHRYLKNLVENKTYGKLVSGTFQRCSPKPVWSWENWYMDEKKSGTVALDLHVHNVDYILYLLGQPDNISVNVTRGNEGRIEQIYSVYNYGDAVVLTEDGWDFHETFPFSETFRVKFEKATVTFNHEGLTIYTENGQTIKPDLKPECDSCLDLGLNVSDLGEYFNELKYFTETLNAGKVPDIAPLEEGIASVRLIWKEIEMCGGAKI